MCETPIVREMDKDMSQAMATHSNKSGNDSESGFMPRRCVVGVWVYGCMGGVCGQSAGSM